MTRSLIRALVALGVMIAVPLGCRSIIGVEERELVENTVSCSTYCTTIQAQCTGTNQQYASQTACEQMCATFEVGTIDDQDVNTLGCRQRVLENGVSTGEVDCPGAGPAGHLQCGTKCEVYCKSLETLCLEQFATFTGTCLEQCAAFTDCGGYTADATRDDDSLQCRFFHLNSASVDPTTHCAHAIAIDHCQDTNTADFCTDGGI